MRYLLSKTLRSRFTKAMRRALPHFRERKAWSGVRGTFVYEWRPSAAVTCYVALVVAEESDRFTIDVAWSGSHRFPAQVRQDSPDEGPRGRAMRFHLRALWQRYRAEPSWTLGDRTPEEQELERALIDPTVGDATKVALLEARQQRAELAAEPGVDTPPRDEIPVTEALARIGPAIEDVMARLRRYALPYFAGVVAAEGAREPESEGARSRTAGPV